MSLKYLVNSSQIPDDGSQTIIEEFQRNTGTDVLVFPDVHMKKGSLITNGMLVSSEDRIFPACLGVENCGYTFGKIVGKNEEELKKSFELFANVLKNRQNFLQYSKEQIRELFVQYLEKDYTEKRLQYHFLGFDSFEDLCNIAYEILDEKLINVAAKSIGTLGGGNHFFEIHKITDVYGKSVFLPGEYVYMLHTDSIAVGDIIYELFSDLHEMKPHASIRNYARATKFKIYRKRYFDRLSRVYPTLIKEMQPVFNPRDEYQSISVQTQAGKTLILAHSLASIFGEMNRDAIIKLWCETQKIEQEKLGSHSHDSVTVEIHEGKTKVVHRNGVQNIGKDEYCLLPSAMGNYSFIMRNAKNENAYFSTNHGTGRMQDKHIARVNYTEEMTAAEMKEHSVSLYRVGNGNLAEQNMHAFKEPNAIVYEMERNNLAYRVARTYPVAVMKG